MGFIADSRKPLENFKRTEGTIPKLLPFDAFINTTVSCLPDEAFDKVGEQRYWLHLDILSSFLPRAYMKPVEIIQKSFNGVRRNLKETI